MSEALDQEKRFYERFWALHRNRDLVKVFKQFGIEVFRRSSVLEGFEDFIIANKFAGRCCVEIGTFNGLTTIVLARHFQKVISIDVMDQPIKRRIVKALKIDNIEFHEVADNAAKAALIRTLDFDAAYVDGDHARDTKEDFELVKKCRRVLFHEYWQAQPAVWNLVNALRSQGNVVTSGKLAAWTN